MRAFLIPPILALCIIAVPSSLAPRQPLMDRPLSPAPSYDSIRTRLADYIWPIEAGKKITSTFAEYRRTHFHGGIDIGTGKQTGFKVFAAQAGYVVKISVSPGGYGRMLFVQHSDGYRTTYAHLLRFADDIEDRVKKEQLLLERFPVEIDCSPGEFPVRQNQLIAFSGESGVGTPHLHFEIRDEHNSIVNPLLARNIDVPDTIPPFFRKISVRPIGAHSTVDGSWDAKISVPRLVSPGHYVLPEPFQISHDAGIGVEARDLSNASTFKHGVYGYELIVDGRTLFEIRLDRAPGFAEAQQIGLYYETELIDKGLGRFEQLYMDTPNALPFYRPGGPQAGIIHSTDFPEGPHTIRILASDHKNNQAEVTGTLILNHPPVFALTRLENGASVSSPNPSDIARFLLYTRRNGDRNWNLRVLTPFFAGHDLAIPLSPDSYDVVKLVAENTWGTKSSPEIFFRTKPSGPPDAMRLAYTVEPGFVRMSAWSTGAFTAPPHVTVYEGGSRRDFVLSAMDINHYSGTFVPLESYAGTRRLAAEAEINGLPVTALEEFSLYPIRAERSDSIVLDNGRLRLYSNPSSAFKTFFAQVEKNNLNGEVRYVLSPRTTVLKGEILAKVTSGSTLPKQGLFFHTTGRPQLLALPDPGTTGEFTTYIDRTFGELSALVDDYPPEISALVVKHVPGGHVDISFRFYDDLSGVEYNTLKMYIDGRFVVPEIDGEHRRASYRGVLEPGLHRVTIQISDKMGNASNAERRFSM